MSLSNRTGQLDDRVAAVERQFDNFIEFLPAAFAEFVFDGLRVTRLNLVARIVSGYTEEDVVKGIRLTDFMTEHSLGLFQEHALELTRPSRDEGLPYARRMEQNIFETTLLRKDGSLYPAEVQGSMVMDTQGRVIGAQVIARDITKRREAEEQQEQLVSELRNANARVRSLEGLLPMCAWCRKVRHDDGYWSELERYVVDHAGASLSHGICPDCATRFIEPDRQA